MKRKIKEIALISVPVVALALVVPGARWYSHWREMNKVPRIDSFELRAPTPWEAYNGAEVGYTSRMVAPRVDDSETFMDMSMEFRNEKGRRWNSATAIWKNIAVAEEFDREGNVWEARGGLRWKKIIGAGETARVHVAFTEKSYQQILSTAAHDFVLKNNIKTVAEVTQSNFTIEKIQWKSLGMARGSEQIHELVVDVKRTNSAASGRASIYCSNEWKLISNSGEWTWLEYDVSPTHSNFDADGVAQLKVSFLENSKLRGQPSRVTGTLSVDGGRPQDLRIDLPNGIPKQLAKGFETTEPTFRTALAPMPNRTN